MRFWSQFEKIDKDHNLDLHNKFDCISQSMEKGSVAEQLIKCFPPGRNSYEKARATEITFRQKRTAYACVRLRPSVISSPEAEHAKKIPEKSLLFIRNKGSCV